MGYASIMDNGALWWERIAGPAALISDLQGALAEGHSVIVNVTTALSYRWVFRDSIGHWLSERDVSVVHVDCSEEYTGGDITEFLLRSIQPDAVTEYLRRKSPQFLRDRGIIHKKMLWIRGVAPQHLRSWMQFISSYRSHDLEHGLLLLEVPESPGMRLPQNLRYFDYGKYIRKDDLRLYASILVESYLDEPMMIKQYAVELVTAMCITDGELVNDLLLHPGLVREDPVQVLQQVIDDNYTDSPRGKEDNHPFALLAQGQEEELRYRIWSAQVRIGFPRIEVERLKIVRDWEQEIRDALAIPYLNERHNRAEYFTDYEKNRISDPYDVEVGMLFRMTVLKQYNDPSQHMLTIPEDRDWVQLLKECRNLLAHRNCCEPVRFYELLSEA